MRNIRIKLVELIATGFYFGFAPKCPGTISSLICSFLIFYISKTVNFINLIFLIIFFIVSVLSAHIYSKHLKVKDPSVIVIDEIFAILLLFSFIHNLKLSILYYILGFFLFRFFDITKIAGIKKFEKISGGFGIILDDIIAVIYSLFILYFLFLIIN